MPNIVYEPENFGSSWGSAFNAKHIQLQCSWPEIVWSAITVGKRDLRDIYKYPRYSDFEIMFRLSLIYAFLKEDRSTGSISKSAVYKDSDPSEKGAVSYFHGLTITKLLASKLFNVQWLLHFDVYNHTFNYQTFQKLRPDLIGLNSYGEWFIFEAKGRSCGFNRDTLDKAKRQTRRLRTINGFYPKLRAAVQSYFYNESLYAKISDPDEYDEDAIDLKINIAEFRLYYYKHIIDLLDYHSENKYAITLPSGGQFLAVKFDELDISVGINKDLYNYLKDQKNIFEPTIPTFESFEYIDTNSTYVGIDGILIQCGSLWSESSMKQQPFQRIVME